MRSATVKHNPAEKRGLGMVFLGMQQPTIREIPEENHACAAVITVDHTKELNLICGEIAALWKEIERLKQPWWKRLFKWIRGTK